MTKVNLTPIQTRYGLQLVDMTKVVRMYGPQSLAGKEVAPDVTYIEFVNGTTVCSLEAFGVVCEALGIAVPSDG